MPASPTRAAWRRPVSAAVTVAENCSSGRRWLTARPGQPTCASHGMGVPPLEGRCCRPEVLRPSLGAIGCPRCGHPSIAYGRRPVAPGFDGFRTWPVRVFMRSLSLLLPVRGNPGDFRDPFRPTSQVFRPSNDRLCRPAVIKGFDARPRRRSSRASFSNPFIVPVTTRVRSSGDATRFSSPPAARGNHVTRWPVASLGLHIPGPGRIGSTEARHRPPPSFLAQPVSARSCSRLSRHAAPRGSLAVGARLFAPPPPWLASGSPLSSWTPPVSFCPRTCSRLPARSRR